MGDLGNLVLGKLVYNGGEGYEIIAGERRWRASQLAQLHEIPALIKELTDIEVLEIAIIENIQRSNLNPYEEALGYKQLLEKFNYTQEELASTLGKSRVYITNLTRLLNLPDSVLKFLKDGKLTAGHARALIGVDKALEIAKSILKNELSVRETERLVKEFSKKNLKSKSTLKPKDEDTEDLPDFDESGDGNQDGQAANSSASGARASKPAVRLCD